MSDEVLAAKIESFIQDLKEEDIEDIVIGTTTKDGLIMIRYNGDERTLSHILRMIDSRMMVDTAKEMILEVFDDMLGEIVYGRENNSQ